MRTPRSGTLIINDAITLERPPPATSNLSWTHVLYGVTATAYIHWFNISNLMNHDNPMNCENLMNCDNLMNRENLMNLQ